MEESPPEHQERVFCCGDDWALAQLAQRASSLRDIQKLSGHGPGQLAVGGLSSARLTVAFYDLKGSFQPKGFYDDMILWILNCS